METLSEFICSAQMIAPSFGKPGSKWAGKVTKIAAANEKETRDIVKEVQTLEQRLSEALYEQERLQQTNANESWKYWQKRFYDLFDEHTALKATSSDAMDKLEKITSILKDEL